MQYFLSPLSNISSNPDNESFYLVFDEGYNSNINIEGSLDFEMEICDLLPVTIKLMNQNECETTEV